MTTPTNVGADASRGHTPGEWRCGDEDEGLDGVQYVEVYAGEYCTPSFRSIAHVEAAFDGDRHLPLDAETRANAALCAAAPELLEALTATLRFIENTEGELGITLDSGELARAVIAKARTPAGET